jgi:hypothetical protein
LFIDTLWDNNWLLHVDFVSWNWICLSVPIVFFWTFRILYTQDSHHLWTEIALFLPLKLEVSYFSSWKLCLELLNTVLSGSNKMDNLVLHLILRKSTFSLSLLSMILVVWFHIYGLNCVDNDFESIYFYLRDYNVNYTSKLLPGTLSNYFSPNCINYILSANSGYCTTCWQPRDLWNIFSVLRCLGK